MSSPTGVQHFLVACATLGGAFASRSEVLGVPACRTAIVLDTPRGTLTSETFVLLTGENDRHPREPQGRRAELQLIKPQHHNRCVSSEPRTLTREAENTLTHRR